MLLPLEQLSLTGKTIMVVDHNTPFKLPHRAEYVDVEATKIAISVR